MNNPLRWSILRDSRFYLVFWILWFCVLWSLSSTPLNGPQLPPTIPIDKALHWGYYGIGGALSTFYFLARDRSHSLPSKYFEFLLLLGLGTGILDEWHQSWYEFRSGNDFGDLIADIIGTYSGIKSAPFVWKFIRSKQTGEERD